MNPELTGRVLGGRFELLSPLGEGGYGAVYLAEQLTMGRQVAIKVIHPRVADTEDFVERFEREARVASRLQHPNTVVYFDFGRDDEMHFLAMELVQGRTLSREITESGPMSLGRAAHIALQVCGALAEAHALGMVHRDLKPANILLTERGGDPDFVKVIDFGLAKIVQGEKDLSGQDLTAEGVLLGTPAYMAPEQIRGKPVDNRCDIYALGVILFVMLTGEKPYEGDTPLGTAVAHLTEDIPLVRALNPGVPEDMERLISRCLGKEPDDRPVDVEELADSLLGIAERHGLDETGPRRRRTGGGGNGSTEARTATLDPTPSTRSGKRLARGMAVLAGDHSSDTAHPSSSLTPPRLGWSMHRGLALGLVAAIVLAAGVTIAVIGSRDDSETRGRVAAEDEAAPLDPAQGPSADSDLVHPPGPEGAADPRTPAARDGAATARDDDGADESTELLAVAPAAERLALGSAVGEARVRIGLGLAESLLGAALAERGRVESSGPVVAREGEDDDREARRERRTPRRERSERREAAGDDDRETADEAAPRVGRLRITAVPYGQVTCNGRSYGRTPIDEEAAVGRYECRVVSPQHETVERVIEVDGRDDRVVPVRFD